LLVNPDPATFPSPEHVISPWEVPLLNTMLLLTSSITITFAHHAIKEDHRDRVVKWMAATVALGVIFMGFQITEYMHAYNELHLTLSSGIYGTTFFLLTGFHGLHVTLGALIIFVIMMRYKKGHFTAERHFGFEAAAWYWHFVDVVWVCLFIFVYIM
jgi:cytochrome c oxidase subunit 3